MFRMTNPVQDYAWGSRTAFSELFGWADAGHPQAEMWMGAHHRAPSEIFPVDSADAHRSLPEARSSGVTLREHLANRPADLGAWAEHGKLPFLLKLLAVESPLSIQVHPSKEQAQRGVAAEEAAGVAADAEDRTYADDNHKPELTVAVSDFSALCGLQDPRVSLKTLAVLTDALAADPAAAGEAAVHTQVTALQNLSREVAEHHFSDAIRRILADHSETFSAAAAALARADVPAGLTDQAADTLRRITRAFPGDPGLFVAMLLQRVDLRPGEALYLDAGVLHAYLHGVGIEIMANSDNVLRGGLTGKRVNVPELLTALTDAVQPVPIVSPTGDSHRARYTGAADEFALERVEFSDSHREATVECHGPTVVFSLTGAVDVHQLNAAGETTTSCTLVAGESIFVSAGSRIRISGEDAHVYVAQPRCAPLEGKTP